MQRMEKTVKAGGFATARVATARVATIKDVASLARVSIKTVSRVVNKEANVQDQTRQRVLRRLPNSITSPILPPAACRASALIALVCSMKMLESQATLRMC